MNILERICRLRKISRGNLKIIVNTHPQKLRTALSIGEEAK